MTKLQLLHRALNERLMAAVEQIMEMVGGTVLEYEEETIRVRKENEVLRRRLRWMEGANPADWPGPSELVTLSTPDESNPALHEECAVSFGYDQDLEPVVIKTEPADIADDALFISPESSLTALPQGTDPGSAGADFGLTDSVNWDSTTSYMAPLDFDPTLPTGVRRWRGGSKRQKMSFACPDCGKVFAKEKRLMFHMRVHSTERPYAYRRRKACFYGDNKRKRKVHSLTQLSKESVDDLSDGSEQTNRSGVSAERHILPIATPVEEQEQDSLSIAESDRTNGDKDPQNSTVKPVPIRHRRKGGRAKMPRCPQCSRVFTRPCRLAVHMKTHAMRKPLTNLPNKEPSGRDETAEKRKLYKEEVDTTRCFSRVWHYFLKNDSDEAICKACSSKVSQGSSIASRKNTSNLWNHLKINHAHEYIEAKGFSTLINVSTDTNCVDNSIVKLEHCEQEDKNIKGESTIKETLIQEDCHYKDAQTETDTLITQLDYAQTQTSDCLAWSTASLNRDGNGRLRKFSDSSVDSTPTKPKASCHPDLQFSLPPQEHLDYLMMQCHGRPDRYGCLLFRSILPQPLYVEWASNTNWDGSRGKCALPMNIKLFIMKTVSQKFPHLTCADQKRIKDRVNEFLRSPRNAVVQRRFRFF